MKKRLVAILLLAGLTSIGCRINPNIDLLEKELRQMEEQLYDLEAEISRREDMLESCRRENKTLKRLVNDSDNEYLDGTGEMQQRLDSSRDGPAPHFAPPAIDLGPAEKLPVPEASADPDSDDQEEVDPQGKIDDSHASEMDAVVTSIFLNSRLTGGYNFDGRQGDEGILVMIEPRNKAGRYVPLAGDLTIVILDPAKTGQESRIARWDFDSIEAARKLRETPLGRGIHLELPWPAEPPTNPQLRVFVRYTTIDGRKLAAKQDISVDLADRISNRWTPASSQQRWARNNLERLAVSSAGIGSRLTNSSVFDRAGANRRQPTARNRNAVAERRRPLWKPYR